ncbi:MULTISPECIES: AAA family ATPase [unclassified Streptomyces]|uniref:AAA family ATPase n=1 Tax=unclassified Streptomyces TaxID=2593676 RepID=UPI002E293966|nr:AAA family ATPase [Streptomyces sp. NBC_00223]
MESSDRHATPAINDTRNAMSGTVHGPSVQAATIHGDVYLGIAAAQEQAPRVPRQLPPGPRHFTGRTESLDALDAALDAALTGEGPALAVISGPPGVGKTSLALSWLHRRGDRFPDGQLYVDLQGHLTEQPVAPSSVLPRFLHALGVGPGHVPGDLAEQTSLFRTLTAGRRLALLCDNAFSAAQVRVLAPVAPGSVCVVTSRWRLTSLLLDGARMVPLEPLDTEDAVELLALIAGQERVAADYAAARDLVDSCGRFPLAVCVGAALLTVRPGWSIAEAAADLDTGIRSTAADEEFSMIACLDQAYAALPSDAARLYRRLGLHPGPEFGAGVVTAVASAEPAIGGPRERAAALVDASLLSAPGPDRYRFHDLIHQHALGRTEADDPGELRGGIVRRVLDHYLATANSADRVLNPQRHRPPPHYSSPSPDAITFTDSAAALEWFATERGNLVSAQRLAADNDLHSAAWQIADAMWPLFSSLHLHEDWTAAYELGVASARACGHRLGEARLLTGLGVALRDAGRDAEALRAFDRAVSVRRDIGDRRGEALVLHHAALTHRALGDLPRTGELLRTALDLRTEVGDTRGQAREHAAIGETESLSGRHTEALAQLTRARDMLTGTGDHHEILVERLLGQAHVRSGDEPAARAHFAVVLDLLDGKGTVFEEGTVYEALGDLDEREGDRASARSCYARAEAVYTGLGAVQDARRAAARLARLDDTTAGSG